MKKYEEIKFEGEENYDDYANWCSEMSTGVFFWTHYPVLEATANSVGRVYEYDVDDNGSFEFYVTILKQILSEK
jgi:hypothetical protein